MAAAARGELKRLPAAGLSKTEPVGWRDFLRLAHQVCKPMVSCSRVRGLLHNSSKTQLQDRPFTNILLAITNGESAIEFVDYGDVGVDFDGMPIEKCGFVAPLAHGVESRLIKHGVAFEDL